MAPTRRPVMLCDASYYGTLAAARTLGRQGVPVTLADPLRIAPALWSRHVSRRLRCPPIAELERFSEWLLAFGRREPGHVICATSDEVSFVLSTHRDELSKSFALYQPDLPAMMRVLDKGKLFELARGVGLDVPETWLPANEADVERAAREADGPLMIKPRTQILLGTHSKGALAPSDPAGLRAAYARYAAANVYGGDVKERFPEATRPMIQRYYKEALDSIYSLSGFHDHTGRSFAVLAASKVLQRPRRMGIGLCFEDAPVDPALATLVRRLCEKIGYYGVFEIEFIRAGNRSLLIDMNPRFYNQLAMDVARGLDLPSLAYAAALGEDEKVASLVAAVPSAPEPYAFCNRFGLEVLVNGRRLMGRMSSEEAAHWRGWCDRRVGGLVDAVADPDDPRPYVLERLQQVYGHVRHLRGFVNMLIDR